MRGTPGGSDGTWLACRAALRMLGIRTFDAIELALGSYRKVLLELAAVSLRDKPGPVERGASLDVPGVRTAVEWREADRLARFIEAYGLAAGEDSHVRAREARVERRRSGFARHRRPWPSRRHRNLRKSGSCPANDVWAYVSWCNVFDPSFPIYLAPQTAVTSPTAPHPDFGIDVTVSAVSYQGDNARHDEDPVRATGAGKSPDDDL
jgi:hypothetical protein